MILTDQVELSWVAAAGGVWGAHPGGQRGPGESCVPGAAVGTCSEACEASGHGAGGVGEGLGRED